MMGLTPYYGYETDELPTKNGYLRLPFDKNAIESEELLDFLKKCFLKKERWSVNELMDHPFVKECKEGNNEVLIPLVKILKNQESCEWILKKDVKDTYLVLYRHDGLYGYHEGLVKESHSVVMELRLNEVTEVDIDLHALLHVNGKDVNGIEHKQVLDLNDDG
ncbi:hypothetical protein WA577_005773, partial [Blastocystis sp. JDR]